MSGDPAIGYILAARINHHSTPSCQRRGAGVASYLAQSKEDCTVTHLSDISVGDFSSPFGGWPVYASHEETCKDGDNTVIYMGRGDA